MWKDILKLLLASIGLGVVYMFILRPGNLLGIEAYLGFIVGVALPIFVVALLLTLLVGFIYSRVKKVTLRLGFRKVVWVVFIIIAIIVVKIGLNVQDVLSR